MKFLKLLLTLGVVASISACQQAAPKAGSATQPQAADYNQLLDSIFKQERQWAGLETKTIQVRGLDIRYSEGGPADGEKLILLHGFTGDKDNWNRMVRYLTDTYHVYIPDLPGHGDSSRSLEQDYSMAEMASVMKGFVDTLGLEKYHIAGNSMGGGLAIQWSVFRPQQVKSLALIDSAGLYEHETPMLKAMKAGNNELLVQRPGDMRKLINKVMADVPFLPEELLQVMEARQIERYPVFQKIADQLNETQKTMGPGAFSIALRSLRMPVLILWGDQDPIFDVAVTKELEANLKTHKTVVMKGVGHVPIFEAPKDSARIYRAFLEELN